MLHYFCYLLYVFCLLLRLIDEQLGDLADRLLGQPQLLGHPQLPGHPQLTGHPQLPGHTQFLGHPQLLADPKALIHRIACRQSH